jgi:hypothetical protein
MSTYDPNSVIATIAQSIVSSDPDMEKGAKVDWSLVATQLALGYIAVSLVAGGSVESIVTIVRRAAESMAAKQGSADAFMIGASIEAGARLKDGREAEEDDVTEETREAN